MRSEEKLLEAQDYVFREVQRQASDRIDSMDWYQTPQDRITRIYRLVVSMGGKKSIFTFTEYELTDNYKTKQWTELLRDHINDIMTELC